MEINDIYWNENALIHFKKIIRSFYQYPGKKAAEKFIAEVEKDILHIKKNPYHGYQEPLLLGLPKRISFYFTNRHIKILYYMEKGNLYIVDFWDCHQ